MESERIVKNNEIEIEEVNVYTDDCGTTRKACVTDCIGGSALITPMENNLAKMMIETINNMMIELYASMAQAEMEKKEKRQKEGMEAKRLRGEWDEVGRPRAIEQEKFNQEFMRVVQKKVTPTQLQRELGLTSSTYYRYRKNFYEIFPEFLQSV